MKVAENALVDLEGWASTTAVVFEWEEPLDTADQQPCTADVKRLGSKWWSV